MKLVETDRAGPERTVAGRRALVVMHPSADSCSPSQIRSLLAEKLAPEDWAVEIEEVRSTEELDRSVERAREAGYDLVIAAGGDGTIARVARHLAGSDLALGILPAGKENNLARELGIPREVGQAAALLAGDHRISHLDALRVGDRHFFLQVGTAVVPVSEAEASAAGRRDGRDSSGLGDRIRKLFGFETRRFTLVLDGRRYRVGAWQVIAFNTGALGSELLRRGPVIHPADGVAEIVMLRVRSLRDLLQAGLRRLGGAAVTVSYRRFEQEALIVPDLPAPVQGDGEAIGTTPLRIVVVPKAVKVLVPAVAPVESAGTQGAVPPRRRHRWRRGWFRDELLHQLTPLGALDTALYLAVTRLPHPPVLNLLGLALEIGMANGRGWTAGVVVASLLRRRRSWREVLELVPALWLTTSTIEWPIKQVFVRPRPFVSLVLASVVGPKPASHSFPSGHSASAFAGAWLLRQRYRRLGPLFYTFASLVAFSRVYVGKHYPSDVVIGAGAGLTLAAVYGPLLRRLLRPFVR